MCRDTQLEVVELTKVTQFLEATNKSQLLQIRNLVMENEILRERLKQNQE